MSISNILQNGILCCLATIYKITKVMWTRSVLMPHVKI